MELFTHGSLPVVFTIHIHSLGLKSQTRYGMEESIKLFIYCIMLFFFVAF